MKTTATIDTDIPLSPTAIQEPHAIVDPPPPRYPSRDSKSTQLPDFVYFTYYDSFDSFITSIHHFSEPSSYKEVILDPFWQWNMTKELSALHKIDTRELAPLHPIKRAIGSH